MSESLITGIRIGEKSLLVEPIADDPNEKTKGGLFLTEAAAERHHKGMATGRVIAKGPDGFEHGHPVKVDANPGDKIIYAKGSAIQFLFKGVHYEIVHFAGHVATLEE